MLGACIHIGVNSHVVALNDTDAPVSIATSLIITEFISADDYSKVWIWAWSDIRERAIALSIIYDLGNTYHTKLALKYLSAISRTVKHVYNEFRYNYTVGKVMRGKTFANGTLLCMAWCVYNLCIWVEKFCNALMFQYSKAYYSKLTGVNVSRLLLQTWNSRNFSHEYNCSLL